MHRKTPICRMVFLCVRCYVKYFYYHLSQKSYSHLCDKISDFKSTMSSQMKNIKFAVSNDLNFYLLFINTMLLYWLLIGQKTIKLCAWSFDDLCFELLKLLFIYSFYLTNIDSVLLFRENIS